MKTTAPRLVMSAVHCEGKCGSASDGCAYRVGWQINPHMQIGTSCPRTAARQSASLAAQLRAAGANVTTLPFVHGLFDSVFVKDAAILRQRGERTHALMGRPTFEQRAGETAARALHLAELGMVVDGGSLHPLEGGDVVQLNGLALLGTGFRSSPLAAPRLAQFLGKTVVTLELVDARLYHLDTALAALADGTLFACREAFSAQSFSALEQLGHPIVEVCLDDALGFALNWVQVGEQIITGTHCESVFAALERLGLQPHHVELTEFLKAGGSAACLTARAA